MLPTQPLHVRRNDQYWGLSSAEDNYDPQNSAHRLERLRALMKAQQLDAYFVTSQETGRIRELLPLGDLWPGSALQSVALGRRLTPVGRELLITVDWGLP